MIKMNPSEFQLKVNRLLRIIDYRNCKIQGQIDLLNYQVNGFSLILTQNWTFIMGLFKHNSIIGPFFCIYADHLLHYFNNANSSIQVFSFKKNISIYTSNVSPQRFVVDIVCSNVLVVQRDENEQYRLIVQHPYIENEQKYKIISQCLKVQIPIHYFDYKLFIQNQFLSFKNILQITQLPQQYKLSCRNTTIFVKIHNNDQIKSMGFYDYDTDIIEVSRKWNYRQQYNTLEPTRITGDVQTEESLIYFRNYLLQSLLFSNKYIDFKFVENQHQIFYQLHSYIKQFCMKQAHNSMETYNQRHNRNQTYHNNDTFYEKSNQSKYKFNQKVYQPNISNSRILVNPHRINSHLTPKQARLLDSNKRRTPQSQKRTPYILNKGRQIQNRNRQAQVRGYQREQDGIKRYSYLEAVSNKQVSKGGIDELTKRYREIEEELKKMTPQKRKLHGPEKNSPIRTKRIYNYI